MIAFSEGLRTAPKCVTAAEAGWKCDSKDYSSDKPARFPWYYAYASSL